MVATSHLLGRDVTSLPRNTVDLPRKLTNARRLRRHALLPFCGYLSNKFLSQHWLQLLAMVFCRQAKIRFLDKSTYTFSVPVTVSEALSVVHDWSNTNMGNRPLRRTVWQDRKAILDHRTSVQVSPHTTARKLLRSQPKTRPKYLTWITYNDTDIVGTIQARGTVVICCPADLTSFSALARYVIREYGQEDIFRLRPTVGKAIYIARSPNAPWNTDIVLLVTRASNKHPLLHDILHMCLTFLVDLLAMN